MKALLPAAIVAALLCGVTAPATANTGCISKTEYGSVHLGYTRSQVEVLIGAQPDYWFQFNNATSTGYNHCGSTMMAGFTFKNGTLWRKEWNWRRL